MAVTSSLPCCNQFQIKDRGTDNSVRILKGVSVIQSYLLFVFALVLVIKTPSFGNSPECNKNAVAVFFGPFKIFDAGRIVGGLATGIVILVYSGVTIMDYLPQKARDQVREIWVSRKRPHVSVAIKSNNEPARRNTGSSIPGTGVHQSQASRLNMQNPKLNKVICLLNDRFAAG